MDNVFTQIVKLKEELSKLAPIKPEWQKKLDEKFRLEFNFNSNHIEGNTLTYRETKMFLSFEKTQGNHELREYEEMQSHDVAFQMIKEWAADGSRELSEADIKNLNKIILVKPFWKEAITEDGQATRRQIKVGTYKEHPNSVRLANGKMFDYTSVQDTPIEMGELIKWYADSIKSLNSDYSAIELAALLHYRFVCIHPFDDGNGRVARLLMNYVLLRYGFPPVVIKSAKKKEYLFALNQADSGQLDKFIEYIAEQVVWSVELVLKATKGESLDEAGDVVKELHLLKREKLLNVKIHKTPKVCFDLIRKVELNIWKSLFASLEEFDDFFAEVTSEIFSNNIIIHKTETVSSIFNSSFYRDKEVEVRPLKRNGIDFEEEEVKTWKWTKKMLSLKSASTKIDYGISCSLQLAESDYLLEIYESKPSKSFSVKKNKIFFDESKNYGTFPLEAEIESIINEVMKYIVDNIKTES